MQSPSKTDIKPRAKQAFGYSQLHISRGTKRWTLFELRIVVAEDNYHR